MVSERSIRAYGSSLYNIVSVPRPPQIRNQLSACLLKKQRPFIQYLSFLLLSYSLLPRCHLETLHVSNIIMHIRLSCQSKTSVHNWRLVWKTA